ANDVPFRVTRLELSAAETVLAETPRASTSGLMRPSAVGPSEEKLAIAPVLSTAPHVMTLTASAGAISDDVAGDASCPSFPAALQHTRPFSVAVFTAIVVTAVAPLRSACVY